MEYVYKTRGVCPKKIRIEIEKDILINVDFLDGGCPGNLAALKKLIIGKNIEEIITLFSGLECKSRKTSCMDQLTKTIEQAKVSN